MVPVSWPPAVERPNPAWTPASAVAKSWPSEMRGSDETLAPSQFLLQPWWLGYHFSHKSLEHFFRILHTDENSWTARRVTIIIALFEWQIELELRPNWFFKMQRHTYALKSLTRSFTKTLNSSSSGDGRVGNSTILAIDAAIPLVSARFHQSGATASVEEDSRNVFKGRPEPQARDWSFEGNRVALKPWEQAAVAVGSAVGALLNPARADLVAALGETTGGPAFHLMLERMRMSSEGRVCSDNFSFLVHLLHPFSGSCGANWGCRSSRECIVQMCPSRSFWCLNVRVSWWAFSTHWGIELHCNLPRSSQAWRYPPKARDVLKFSFPVHLLHPFFWFFWCQ